MISYKLLATLSKNFEHTIAIKTQTLYLFQVQVHQSEIKANVRNISVFFCFYKFCTLKKLLLSSIKASLQLCYFHVENFNVYILLTIKSNIIIYCSIENGVAIK